MVAEVIVDVLNAEVDKVFDYNCDNISNICVGDRVLLPFANRTIEGYVLGLKDKSDFDESRLKSIIKRLDKTPIIKPFMLTLCKQMKEKLHLRMLDAIRLVLPSPVRNNKVKHIEKKQIKLSPDFESYLEKIRANATNERGIIRYLQEVGECDFTTLSKKFSSATVNKLIKNNVLLCDTVVVNRKVENFAQQDTRVVLNETQKNAVSTILAGGKHLLHGVTGSGKTEVYLNAIEEVLKSGKTAIMLVPEISLTPQMIRIFSGRFGDQVALLHSGLTLGEKYDEWYRLYSGDAKIAIGARSCIFAPLDNLGIIIIDEEHDSSYVADSNPRYNTFDIACLRSENENCPLVVGSATPSVETYYLAKTGALNLIKMPKRVNNKSMPQINIVDMCSEFRSGNRTPFSKPLLENMVDAIDNKNQIILFINRRGFSSFLMCRDCGYIPKCDSCDVSLTYHKADDQLKCHYCGKRFRAINTCPVCGGHDLKYGGVGTQQVVEELNKLFPSVPVFRMDNDTTETKNAHGKILKQFGDAKPSILVGTQMVAKGHDFPRVSLVGILDADLSLFFSDFRANEKTFQLITQVAGRAGRSETEGKVVLQTYFPNNYVYKLCANYDYNRFFDKEINLRETTNFPPFSKIVRLLFSSSDEEAVRRKTHDVFMELKQLRVENKDDFYYLEGMKSPVTKIKNKYRYQILIRLKLNNCDKIINKIYEIIDKNYSKNISTFVELNPLSLS